MTRKVRPAADTPSRSTPPGAAAAPPSRPTPRQPPRSVGRRVAVFAARWSLVVGIWITVAVGFVLGWYALQLPPIDQLEDMTRRPGVTVVASDGSMLANYG